MPFPRISTPAQGDFHRLLGTTRRRDKGRRSCTSFVSLSSPTTSCTARNHGLGVNGRLDPFTLPRLSILQRLIHCFSSLIVPPVQVLSERPDKEVSNNHKLQLHLLLCLDFRTHFTILVWRIGPLRSLIPKHVDWGGSILENVIERAGIAPVPRAVFRCP